MRLPIWNRTSKEMEIVIEPACNHYYSVPPGGKAVFHLDDDYCLEVRDTDCLALWIEGNGQDPRVEVSGPEA